MERELTFFAPIFCFAVFLVFFFWLSMNNIYARNRIVVPHVVQGKAVSNLHVVRGEKPDSEYSFEKYTFFLDRFSKQQFENFAM